jgi:hypothetical protein
MGVPTKRHLILLPHLLTLALLTSCHRQSASGQGDAGTDADEPEKVDEKRDTEEPRSEEMLPPDRPRAYQLRDPRRTERQARLIPTRASEFTGIPSKKIPIADEWKPPTPKVTAGRCYVRFEKLDQPKDLTVGRDFVARNGDKWKVGSPFDKSSHDVNRYTGLLQGVSRSRMGRDVGPDVALNHRVVWKRVYSLIARNADLFGLEECILERLKWHVWEERYNKKALGWSGRAELELPGPHHERFPELSRRVGVTFKVRRDGEIDRVHVGLGLPEGHLCLEPEVTAEQARRTKGIVGRKLSFFGIGGGRIESPPVLESQVGEAELEVYGFRTRDWIEHRLVYMVPVKRRMWEFIVDAISGEILDIIQRFKT